jgi:hypothetical protein
VRLNAVFNNNESQVSTILLVECLSLALTEMPDSNTITETEVDIDDSDVCCGT